MIADDAVLFFTNQVGYELVQSTVTINPHYINRTSFGLIMIDTNERSTHSLQSVVIHRYCTQRVFK